MLAIPTSYLEKPDDKNDGCAEQQGLINRSSVTTAIKIWRKSSTSAVTLTKDRRFTTGRERDVDLRGSSWIVEVNESRRMAGLRARVGEQKRVHPVSKVVPIGIKPIENEVIDVVYRDRGSSGRIISLCSRGNGICGTLKWNLVPGTSRCQTILCTY